MPWVGDRRPGTLDRMKLLLTNDDGVDAAGLQALLDAARWVGDAVVVAPGGPQSGVSHAVTTGTAVRFEARGPGRFAVSGTPADCVRVGLHRLCPDAAWVLSGINHGGNLGADVYYSGTVAAAREAVLHGWPGVALSHYRRRGAEFDWTRAAGWAARVLADLLARPPVPGAFYNVNLPHLAPGGPVPDVVVAVVTHPAVVLVPVAQGQRVRIEQTEHNVRVRIVDVLLLPLALRWYSSMEKDWI